MKLLYLTNQLYLHGGLEKILAQKLNYWQQVYGYEVILCTTSQKENTFVYPINCEVQHIDLDINYLSSKSYFHPRNLLKSVIHYKALRSIIKDQGPDIVISVNYTPEQFFLPFIAKKIPKVKEFHSSGEVLKKSKNFSDKLKNQLFKLFRKYDALVLLNEDERKYYPYSNLNVIPNFIEVPHKIKEITKEKTIIAAGRIAPVKQFDHLIQAWSLIAYKHPNWQVKLFGNGDLDLLERLENQIQSLKIPNIELMGATSHLPREMQRASLYALTSATECFPMVLLESQVAGLPILSYDCPNGPRHIVEHEKNGLLTPANEIDTFAGALSRLIANEALRTKMGINAKHSVKNYSQQIVMRQWLDLFNSLKPQ